MSLNYLFTYKYMSFHLDTSISNHICFAPMHLKKICKQYLLAFIIYIFILVRLLLNEVFLHPNFPYFPKL